MPGFEIEEGKADFREIWERKNRVFSFLHPPLKKRVIASSPHPRICAILKINFTHFIFVA